MLLVNTPPPRHLQNCTIPPSVAPRNILWLCVPYTVFISCRVTNSSSLAAPLVRACFSTFPHSLQTHSILGLVAAAPTTFFAQANQTYFSFSTQLSHKLHSIHSPCAHSFYLHIETSLEPLFITSAPVSEHSRAICQELSPKRIAPGLIVLVSRHNGQGRLDTRLLWRSGNCA